MAEISAKSFIPESLPGYSADIAGQLGLLWELIRVPLIAPLLQICVYICLAMSIMVFMERVYMGVVIVLVKLFWKKPDKRYNWEAMKDDVEMGSAAFPMVLVQIPMFNEREVCFSLFLFTLQTFTQTHTWVCVCGKNRVLNSENWKGVCSFLVCFGEQVYKISIGAACNLSWPSDRLVIQVLDDSTDLAIKVLINIITL